MDGTLIGVPQSAQLPVLAAGCVVWRRHESSREPVVALVHRPRYDDWSLPKGKADPVEFPTTTAVRETREETGLSVALGRRLPSQVYPVGGNGVRKAKVVHWWLADIADATVPLAGISRVAGSGTIEGPDQSEVAAVQGMASGEIDRVVWLSLSDAAAALTHNRDRVLLEAVALAPIPTSRMILVRHGSAGSRARFKGDDRDRPLDALGIAQRDRVTELARCFGATSVFAAEPVRCTETVRGYAQERGIRVAVDSSLGEQANQSGVTRGLGALRRLAAPPGCTLVCSQGGVIPEAVRHLHEDARLQAPDSACPKGSAWVLDFHGGRLTAADFHPTLDPLGSPLPPGAVVSAGEYSNPPQP